MYGRTRSNRQWIEVERDVEVLQIPDGDSVMLKEGQKVRIHQQLGGQYTLMTEWGYLVRLANENADAIGKEPLEKDEAAESDEPLEDRVWEAMKQCYDPEIPINVVDLGLIYECDVRENDEGQNVVDVEMTLTAPGCGMGEVIANDVKTAVASVHDVDEVNVNLVFDPPWDRTRMSEAAMLELGFL